MWSDGGFSLPEAILAMLIIALTMFALLRSFSYGTLYMEKLSLRRQGLAYLQQRMEYLRHKNDNGTVGLAAETGTVQVELTSERGGETVPVSTAVVTEVVGGLQDGNLTYDSVYVAVQYEHDEIADTLALATRFYVTQ